MRKLALTILLYITCLAPAYAITINQPDFGGNLLYYMRYWNMVRDSNDKVVIDAPCISGCTFFLGIIPPNRVCVTPRAALGLHTVIDGDTQEADYPFTQAFYRWLYPQWVQQWIKDHGGLEKDPKYMYPEDMKGHINLCPGYSYDSVSPDNLIHHAPEEQNVLEQLKRMAPH